MASLQGGMFVSTGASAHARTGSSVGGMAPAEGRRGRETASRAGEGGEVGLVVVASAHQKVATALEPTLFVGEPLTRRTAEQGHG